MTARDPRTRSGNSWVRDGLDGHERRHPRGPPAVRAVDHVPASVLRNLKAGAASRAAESNHGPSILFRGSWAAWNLPGRSIIISKSSTGTVRQSGKRFFLLSKAKCLIMG